MRDRKSYRLTRTPQDELYQIIIDGYDAGMSVAEIAKKAGSTCGSIRVLAHRLDLSHPKAKLKHIPNDIAERSGEHYQKPFHSLSRNEDTSAVRPETRDD